MPSPMRISREGLNLLKEMEGFRPRAVELASGRWLIGYGHTKYARANMRVTEQEAELLLRHDLLGVIDELNTKIFAPLSQGQFDALVLFAHNIGLQSFRASGVCDLINIGQPLAAAQEIGRWRVAMVNGAPVVIDALARRRAAELDLYLRTVDNVRPATTHLLTPMSEQPVGQLGMDSPLQVFRPAPVPNPQQAEAERPAAEAAQPATAPQPPAPEVSPPRLPSTLRTRFHDLIARRRAAGSAGEDALSVAETETSDRGVLVLSGGVVLFAAIALFGFLIERTAIAIAGLAATALCISSLARILDRPRAPRGTEASDEAPD